MHQQLSFWTSNAYWSSAGLGIPHISCIGTPTYWQFSKYYKLISLPETNSLTAIFPDQRSPCNMDGRISPASSKNDSSLGSSFSPYRKRVELPVVYGDRSSGIKFESPLHYFLYSGHSIFSRSQGSKHTWTLKISDSFSKSFPAA